MRQSPAARRAQGCLGRSPDHPIGLSIGSRECALHGAIYTERCAWMGVYCGFFHVAAADWPVASQYGKCRNTENCLWLSSHLPGGFDCYDERGQLVKP